MARKKAYGPVTLVSALKTVLKNLQDELGKMPEQACETFWNLVVLDDALRGQILSALARVGKERLALMNGPNDVGDALRTPTGHLAFEMLHDIIRQRNRLQRKRAMGAERLEQGKALLRVIKEYGGKLNQKAVNHVLKNFPDWPCVRDYRTSKRMEKLRTHLGKLARDTRRNPE